MVKFLKLSRFETKLALLSGQRVLGSKTHNHLLTVYRGKNRNTDIKLLSVHHLCDTSVLRLSFFRNIHSADNLDTGHHRRKQSDTVGHFFIQCTVDTVSDTYLTFHRLNMNIGSTLSDRLFDHCLDKLYNRGIVYVLAVHIFLLGHLALFFSRIFFQRRVDLHIAEIFIQSQHNASRGGNHRLHLQVRDDRNIIHCRHIHGISHSHTNYIHVIRCILKRQHFVTFQYITRHESENVLRDRHILQVDHIIAQLVAERSADCLLCRKSLVNQCFTQLAAAALL